MIRSLVPVLMLAATACGNGGPLFQLQASVKQASLVDGTEPLHPVDSDSGVPAGLVPAILWRSGCAGCGVSGAGTFDDAQRTLVELQPIDVSGHFPDNFSIVFNDEPPQDIVDANFGYPTGVLVLVAPGGQQSLHRDLGFVDIGFTFPLLFPDEAATLGIATMTPLYVSFVASGTVANDLNLKEGVPGEVPTLGPLDLPLGGGYHVSKQNGVALNADARRVACINANVDEENAACLPSLDLNQCSGDFETAHCGTAPETFQSIHVLAVNDAVSLTIGGDEDLLTPLVGKTVADFVEQ